MIFNIASQNEVAGKFCLPSNASLRFRCKRKKVQLEGDRPVSIFLLQFLISHDNVYCITKCDRGIYMDIKRVNWICQRVEKKMNAGDFLAALKDVRKIKNPDGHPYLSYMVSGNLIDVGNALEREDLVQEGVELLEKHKDTLLLDQHRKSTVLYNLGNGYDSLFLFENSREPLAAYFKSSKLNRVKEYYLEALACDESGAPRRLSQIWTNLGNCFKKIGRVVEALECFEKALELDPYHGMAMGNKGVALSYYAHITGDHFGIFLNEAYYLLYQALELGVLPESRNYFLGYLNKIEKFYPDKRITNSRPDLPGVEVEGDSEFEKFLIQYCLDNKLYLNICNVCQKCNAAIGDTLVIKNMLVPDNSKTKQTDPFLRLSSYLNQMKQDYVTARFLLILSRFKNIDLHFVDKRVMIVDTYDFNVPNVYTQLEKFAFKSFFDILDKEAIFINEYLKLGMQENRIKFRDFWFSDFKNRTVHQKMLEIENFSLNAIFDLNQELEEGRFKNLRSIRNALTHRFFNVKPFADDDDKENMSELNFVDQTIELAKIVRNSLIYLMNFVYIEEQKKVKDLNGKYLTTIQAYEIPDKLKRRNLPVP